MKKIIYSTLMLLLLFALPQATKASVTISEVHTNVNCNGASTGAIDITPSGGTAPYTYNWNDGIVTQDRTNIPAGNYSVTVTDNLGATNSILISISESSAMTTTKSITSVYCGGGNTGAIDLTVSGGSPGYTYAWSDFVYTEDRTNLTAANYYVTVTDSKGCTKVDSANVTQPPGMVINKTITNVTCGSGANGAIDLTVQYGIPGYTYLWNDAVITEDRTAIAAGTYSVTVTDATGCTTSASATVGQTGGGMSVNTASTNPLCYGGSNGTITIPSVIGSVGPYTFHWGDGATVQNRTGLSAGSYTVTATSSTGCTAATTINLTQPAQINVTLTPVSLTCFGSNNGAINTTVTGGTSPYLYNWGGLVFTQNRTGLSTGSYTVTVTDFKGCTATQTTFVPQPLQLVVTATTSPQACIGGPTGSVTTTVVGGTGSYSYWWGSAITTPNRPNVNAGNYTVTVTDANGCTASASATVASYTPMVLSSTQVNNICYGASTGSIDLTVANGWSPYTYAWGNGATTQDITSLAKGIYTVTVLDNHSCTATKTVTITQPLFPISINSTVTDVTCNGGNNGAINTTVSNGVSPYSYNWGGINTQNRTGLSSGSYSLTVTDNNSCTASAAMVVNQPTPIIISPSVTDAACFGSSTGSINLTVTGSFAPYTYSWNDGATTQNRTGLASGTYPLTVTDNHACSASANVVVSQPMAITIAATVTNVTCYGANTGSISISITDGVAPFTFNWGGVTTQNRTSIAAGNYTVTVTDNTGCTASNTSVVTQPTQLTVSKTVTNVLCNGANNGAINITPAGGTSPYTFNWGSSIVTQNRTSLAPGTYTVTVTDNNSCTISTSAIITQPAALSLSTVVSNVSCNGAATGIITLTVTGGTTGYSFNWSNGPVTQNNNNIPAGNYSVTVTDANSCSALASVVITQPSAVTTSTVVTNATCYGSANGSVDLTVAGGTGAYTYVWSNGPTTQDISNLPANTYNVTVKDANNCTASTSATVTQPTQLTLSATHVNVSCNGTNNGSIDLSVTGGSPAYTYSWSNGAVTQDISSLTAQTYTVTVNDTHSCSATTSVSITQPPVLTLSDSHTNVLCNGGNTATITITVAGGTSPNTFHWSDGPITQNRTGLAAGSYTVTVTDANACTASVTSVITQSTALTLSTTKTDVTCNGAATGAIDLSVTGGAPNYLYHWDNNMVTQDLAGINAGTYTVTVTDANSCTAVTAATITQPAPITLSFTLVNATCYGGNNGSISTTASGGNGGYHYAWSNGGNTSTISSLIAGNYSLSLSDATSCATTLSFTIAQPSQILLSETHTNISCIGPSAGAIDLSASGGSFPYTYVWSNGATSQDLSSIPANAYTVTATDNAACTVVLGPINITQQLAPSLSTVATNVACNGAGTGAIDLTVTGGGTPYIYHWNNSATSQDLTAVAAGNYTVTVTDANSCTAFTSAVINQSTAIQVTLTKADATCFGSANGSIATTVTGGNNGYTYNWSNGSSASGLSTIAAATYTLTIHDAQNCSAVASATVAQPSAIVIAETHTDVNCNGNNNGTINITVTGGANGYSYAWSNSSSSNNLTGLAANNYTLTVTDANACTASKTVSITQPAAIVLSETHKPYACSNHAGAIDLTVNGGTSPYNYSWTGNVTTQDRTNLTAGNYSVVVTDAHSCTSTTSVAIAQLTPLSTSITKTDVTCHGGHNGAINLFVQGGTAPYNFNWNQGGNTAALANLPASNYRVLIIDSNSCNTVDSTTIIEPASIQIAKTVSDVTCYGLANGSINITATGGTSAYTYNWNTSATTQNLSNLSRGNYSLTVTDPHSCTATTGNILVNEPQQLNIASTVTPIGCSNHNDGAVQLQVTGGIAPFNYNWSNSVATANITNLPAGNYDVTVTDSKGCKANGSYTITATPPLVITPVVKNNSCPEVQNGAIDLTVTGGTPALNFNWSNGSHAQNLHNIGQGLYAVTVTDSRNCSAQANYSITYDYVLTVHADSSATINVGESVQLTAITNVDHGNVYSWTPATGITCSTCASTEATPVANTFYTVYVTDANGCKTSDTLSITVNSITDIFIPNAFTPNGDGNNDELQMFGDLNTIAYLDFAVFNRWGEKVFESSNHHFTWDGTYKGEPAPQGVYIYTAKIVFINGQARNNMKGSLTLIR